ncbi:MAG: hypothetical protein RRZ68_00405 [Oscillospiraceae bacterium]
MYNLILYVDCLNGVYSEGASKALQMNEKLLNWGCDVDGAMERLVNDCDCYLKCLNILIKEETFNKLKIGLEKEDADKSIFAAYTLKGVLGNLGITPMYEVNNKIIEMLYSKDYSTAKVLFDELMALKSELQLLIK